MHRQRDVRRERPGGGRPHQKCLTGAWGQSPPTGGHITHDREAHEDARVRHLAVAVDHLVLGERRAAPRAPRHRAVPPVEPALLVAQLEHVPDVRDVQVAVRVVGARPIHPLAHANRALRDRRRGPIHTRAARLRESGQSVFLDVALAVQVQLALDLHLDPEPLAIESVLVALVEAPHRLVPLVQVLVRARPCGMNAHALDVRGDRPVEEPEARSARVLLPEDLEALLALPEVEHAVIDLWQVERRGHRLESRLRSGGCAPRPPLARCPLGRGQ